MQQPRLGKPHLVQQCATCDAAWATEIAVSQIDLGPVELARAIAPEQMSGYLAFCDEHEKQGHELGMCAVMAFEAIPTA